MCMVVDMCAISVVFNDKNEAHADFRPVLNWIVEGEGKLVIGGSTYAKELAKLGSYLGLIKILSDLNKVVPVDDRQVDEKERELAGELKHSGYDDPHIVALLVISGCRIIVSTDERGFPFFTKKEWFGGAGKTPKIYCSGSIRVASKILSRRNVSEICGLCEKPNKDKKKKLRKAVGI